MGKFLYNIAFVLALLYISGALTYGAQLPQGLRYTVYRKAKASEIGSYMNKNTDPCEDFYEFSCGKFAKMNPASFELPSTGLLERLRDGMSLKIKKLLKTLIEKKPEELEKTEHIDRQFRNFYMSCMNINEIKIDSYRSIIDEFGKMPVLEGDSWSEADFDLVQLLSKIVYNYGVETVIKVAVGKDLNNSKANAAYLLRPLFELKSYSMYLSENTEPDRLRYMESIANNLRNYLGVDSGKADVTAQEILNFEVELARGLRPEEGDFNPIEVAKLRTLDEFQSIYGSVIDVKRLVHGSLGEMVDKMYDYDPKYTENFVQVVGRTPKRIMANYIYYNLIAKFAFTPGNDERQIFCIENTNKQLGKIVDNLIYRTHNSETLSNDIKNMCQEIKSVFRERLQSDASLRWINNQTRHLAIEKLDAMTIVINSFDLQELNEEYKDVNLSDEDYIMNIRYLKGLEAFLERNLLHKPAETVSEGGKTSPSNMLNDNQIQIPMSVLQPAFMWDVSYPKAIMYGTLGAWIGHELIHGFDNAGQDYDAEGNNKPWWDEQSLDRFNERKKCFMDQYHQYKYYGQQIPYTEDQAENIADNGGLRLSHAAYRRWLQAQTGAGRDIKSEHFPTMSYTNMQLFFISFAQTWCNDMYEDYRLRWLITERHLPGEFRVIGTMSNMKEFSEEFQCQSGTPMNPVNKCLIY